MKLIRTINTILVVMAVILIINLIQPLKILTGNVVYGLDTTEPKCYFKQFTELNKIPLDRCCYEIQKQITCESAYLEESDLKCYTSEISERYYLISRKMFNYCKNDGYDVKIK